MRWSWSTIERGQPTSVGWPGIGGQGPAAVQVAAPAVGGRPRAGVVAQAASGSRSWCRRRGCTARPWRPPRGPWPGRRRAAPRTAPAAPPLAVPGQGRAKSHRPDYRTPVREPNPQACVPRQEPLSACMDGLPSFHEAARSLALQPSPPLSALLADPAIRAGEVPIDRGPADPERVGNRRDGAARALHLPGHLQLVTGHDRRPAVAAPGRAAASPAAGAFAGSGRVRTRPARRRHGRRACHRG